MPNEHTTFQQDIREALSEIKTQLESEPTPKELEGTEFETELVRLRLRERALKLELADVQSQIERLTQ